jgi:protein-histidine pros-kinase
LAFTVRFGPIDRESLETACESFPSLKDLRALVVCGEPSELKRFTNLLQSWGVRTECAADSDVGCSVMRAAADRNEPFRLLLLDSHKASMDPFAIAEIMTRFPKHEDAAMVVIYPSNLQVDSARCLSAGIGAYLGRPFSDEQLYIALRLALQHAIDQKTGSAVPASGRMEEKSLRILLVEDNPVNQKAESLLLSRWGHQVHAVESGEEALSVLKESEFNLVLMDIEMSGMNGIEAMTHIRRQEQARGRHVPVIAMTAHALDTDRKRCLDAGMDGYVSKPFRPDHLRRLIAAIASGTPQKPTSSIPVNTGAEVWKDLPVWDRSEARRLADGNDKALRLTIRAFLKDLRQTLPVAENAAEEKDAKALACLVHRWKGTLGLLGARRALYCAIRLEEVCGRKEPGLLLECFGPLRDELLAVEKAMRLEIEEDVPCKC